MTYSNLISFATAEQMFTVSQFPFFFFTVRIFIVAALVHAIIRKMILLILPKLNSTLNDVRHSEKKRAQIGKIACTAQTRT